MATDGGGRGDGRRGRADRGSLRRSLRRPGAAGTALNALSWQTEAPLRMLLNNLDPEVAEHPEELVVYGGSGRAARSHQALRDIVRTLLRLRDDETLLVQSGKPVGVFRTHAGCAAGADRQLAGRAEMGDMGQLPQARGGRTDDVRADDRGLVDLHRDPGDLPRHVPDLLRRWGGAFRHRRPLAGGRC